jgi:hypothetical protein
MKRKRHASNSGSPKHDPINWNDLAEDALRTICSFCDMNDILSLRCSCSLFRSSAKLALRGQCETLSFSSLVGNVLNRSSLHRTDYNNNKISYWLKRDKQEECMNTLLTGVLESRGSSSSKVQFHRMDFCNMKDISSISLTPQHLSALVSLDFSFCSRLHPSVLMNIIVPTTTTSKNGHSLPALPPPPLEELYLNGCRKIMGVHVQSLVHHFTEIKVLHLAGCSQTIGDDCVESICTSLRKLESLDLMGLSRVTDRSSILLFTKLKHLQYLNVDNCERLRWDFLRPFLQTFERWMEDASAEDILGFCRAARNGDTSSVRNQEPFASMDWNLLSFRLKFANVSFGPGTRGGLPPYGLSTLAISSLGCLREVNVSGSRIIDNDIKHLVISCRDSLKSLDISCCDNIRDQSLHHISEHGENIVYLDISACINITDSGMKVLHLCQRLTSLKASSLIYITDNSVSFLRRLKRLVLLDLSNCSKVGRQCVERVICKLPLLVEVDVRNISSSRRGITSEQQKKHLSIFNGKRCTAGDNTSLHLSHCCSALSDSQRTTSQQGARPQRMYHCRQCELLPKYNRGMCYICASHCHKSHAGVYQGAVTFFYCDCAFGFHQEDCVMLPPQDRMK